MSTTTSRLGLVQPVGSDSPSVFRTGDTANMNTLDAAVIYESGTLASRPLATSVAAGTIYYATDTGVFYVATGSGAAGTAWVVLAGLGSTLLPVSGSAGTFNAATGTMVTMSPGGTLVLPTPVAGARVGVLASSLTTGASPVTVQAGGGAAIYGVGLSGVGSFLLGTGAAYVELEAFSSTQWALVSGQQDTGWVDVTPAAAAGISHGSLHAQVRLCGNQLLLKGQLISSGSQALNATWATVPGFAIGIVGNILIYGDLTGGAAVSGFGLGLSNTGHLFVASLPPADGTVGASGGAITLSGFFVA